MEKYGPYHLLRRIATGGMAEVFLARQVGIEGFEREVILKRILQHRARDEEFCTMFLDEARLIARLNHPYIAQIYDLGQEHGTYYIAMEYVQGIDLAHLLDSSSEQGQAGLPLPVAIPIIASLCEALEYIHSRTDEFGHPLNIVHRDLGPKNVMVSYDGAVKLIDFGIAKAASQVYETGTGVIKGTYGYMAPEQVTRKRPIDSRADLFALGVLTYELTTGIHPFDAPDEVAILGKLVRCDFDRPTQKLRSYPKKLERIILNCMMQDPEDRPISARDVMAFIEGFSTDQDIPLTMSRISSYVRQKHVPKSQDICQIPALLHSSETTAMISQRLANHADGTLEIHSPHPMPARVATLPMTPETDKKPVIPVKPQPQREWPWTEWARREKIIAILSLVVAALASIASAILILSTSQLPTDDGEMVDSRRDLGPDSSPQSTTPNRVDAAPIVSTIRVKSLPVNATILLEGKNTGFVTPSAVTVPAGKRLVWIRVELEGYQQVERQIDVSLGEAIFNLTKLVSPDAQPTDAEVAPPEEP